MEGGRMKLHICCRWDFVFFRKGEFFLSLLVVSAHLKNISQIGSFPQVGVNIKDIWNHHLSANLIEHIYTYKLNALMTIYYYTWDIQAGNDNVPPQT